MESQKQISITFWMKPKDNQSKIVVQSANHMMTAMWVSNELPNIFMKVIQMEQKKICAEEKNIEKETIDDVRLSFDLNEHNSDSNYQCDRCEFTSKVVNELKTHVETKHFECGKCTFTTTVANDLKAHFQNMHNQKKLIEHYCSK